MKFESPQIFYFCTENERFIASCDGEGIHAINKMIDTTYKGLRKRSEEDTLFLLDKIDNFFIKNNKVDSTYGILKKRSLSPNLQALK